MTMAKARSDWDTRIGRRLKLRDLHILSVVGAEVTAGDLLQTEQLHKGVRRRDFAGIQFRH